MPIHPELKKQSKKIALVVFAGAGTSIPLKLPGWEDFVLEVPAPAKTTKQSSLIAFFNSG